MVALGLLSLGFAAFMLYRRRDVKRFFAYSSIEHMGLATFAFGIGGALANFAGLLHMGMHSLTKSAIFFAVGHIAQVKRTQQHLRHHGPDRKPSAAGLGPCPRRRRHRRHAAARHLHERVPDRQLDVRPRSRCWPCSWCSAFSWASVRMFLRLTQMAFGPPSPGTGRVEASYLPMFAHLALVLVARRLPAGDAGQMVQRRRAAVGVRREPMAFISALIDARQPASRRTDPGRASSSMKDVWREAVAGLAAGEATLLGLWSDGTAVHMALTAADEFAVVSLPVPERRFPSVALSHPPALRLERTIRDLYGLEPEGASDLRPWLDHNRWGMRHPLGEREAADPSGDALHLLSRRRPAHAPDPRGARARRHHRARPLPLHRQRRDRRAPGGAARLRAQGASMP